MAFCKTLQTALIVTWKKKSKIYRVARHVLDHFFTPFLNLILTTFDLYFSLFLKHSFWTSFEPFFWTHFVLFQDHIWTIELVGSPCSWAGNSKTNAHPSLLRIFSSSKFCYSKKRFLGVRMRSSSLSAKDFNFENATVTQYVQINQKCLISIFHVNNFFFFAFYFAEISKIFFFQTYLWRFILL